MAVNACEESSDGSDDNSRQGYNWLLNKCDMICDDRNSIMVGSYDSPDLVSHVVQSSMSCIR